MLGIYDYAHKLELEYVRNNKEEALEAAIVWIISHYCLCAYGRHNRGEVSRH